MAPMQWEYGVITFDRHGIATGIPDAAGAEPPGAYDHARKIEKHLTEMADNGWELVTFIPAPQNQEGRWLYHGIFKREKAG
jgi:hypothetical protein